MPVAAAAPRPPVWRLPGTPAASRWQRGSCGDAARGLHAGSGVRCRSTPSPAGIAWLSAVEHGANGANGNGAGLVRRAAPGGGGLAPAAAAAAASELGCAKLDAVVMLAGGLLPDGGLPEWVTRRLDTAHDVQLLQRQRCPVLMLGALRWGLAGA
jgi:hypothetical protein